MKIHGGFQICSVVLLKVLITTSDSQTSYQTVTQWNSRMYLTTLFVSCVLLQDIHGVQYISSTYKYYLDFVLHISSDLLQIKDFLQLKETFLKSLCKICIWLLSWTRWSLHPSQTEQLHSGSGFTRSVF